MFVCLFYFVIVYRCVTQNDFEVMASLLLLTLEWWACKHVPLQPALLFPSHVSHTEVPSHSTPKPLSSQGRDTVFPTIHSCYESVCVMPVREFSGCCCRTINLYWPSPFLSNFSWKDDVYTLKNKYIHEYNLWLTVWMCVPCKSHLYVDSDIPRYLLRE